jgi:hypothetical protein
VVAASNRRALTASKVANGIVCQSTGAANGGPVRQRFTEHGSPKRGLRFAEGFFDHAASSTPSDAPKGATGAPARIRSKRKTRSVFYRTKLKKEVDASVDALR